MRRWLWLVLLGACAAAPPEPRTAVPLPQPDPVLREVTRDAVHQAEREGLTLERVGEAQFAVTERAQIDAVTIPAGECRVFVLVRASGVVEAAAALYRPDGRRLARDLARAGEPPAVGACAGERALGAYWHVSVRGAGLVRGLEFSLDARTAAARGLVEPTESSELDLALSRRGFAPRAPERVLRLGAGERTRFPLSLGAHRCLTLVVRGAAASLVVREDERTLARDGSGGEQALQLCAGDADRELVAEVIAQEAGELSVRRYDADERSVGGEEGLWLGERLPAVLEAREPPAGARLLDLGPAEVVEVPLAAASECTPVRVVAGRGSRGVWLDDPTEPKPSAEGCVRGARARLGSLGGGRVWLLVGEGAEAPTPRPPAPRGARR